MKLQTFNVFGVARVSGKKTSVIMTAIEDNGNVITKSAVCEAAIPGLQDNDVRLVLISVLISDEPAHIKMIHTNGAGFDTGPIETTISQLIKSISISHPSS